MSRPIDTCPACGEREIIAVCTVVAEYAVNNDGEGDQDWSRRTVDDDTSVPTSFRCDSCGLEFGKFTLDEKGYLVGLGSAPSEAAEEADAMTAEGFRRWLTERIADWCGERGLPSDGESEDLGDAFRDMDSEAAFDAIGVTVFADPIGQCMYFVGPGSSWFAATPFELGPERETIWWSPLSALRTDVPVEELRRVERSLRERADEIANLLAGHDSRERMR